MQGRLARAAAALAEAESAAGVRAGASPARAAAQPSDEPDPESAAQARSAPPPRAAAPPAPVAEGPSPAPEPPSSGGPGRRGRGSRSKPRTGWGAVDPGERPDWVPPPEDPAEAVPDADAESVARAIVLRQLSMAPRSRSQLERKLRQRGCEDDVAAKVLDRMTEVGLVDDEAYAQMLVRSRQKDKGLARRALAHELRKQGIDPEIADEALGQVGAGDERLRAEQLVAKKLRSMRGLAPDVQTRRLAAMLARKGYSGEVAWPIVRDAVDGLPEHRRD